jgi:hypothetical protein
MPTSRSRLCDAPVSRVVEFARASRIERCFCTADSLHQASYLDRCCLLGFFPRKTPAADLVLIHGHILTVDANDSVAQAVAVRQVERNFLWS